MLATALSLSGCRTVIDDGKLEAQVKANLQNVQGVEIESVDCPSDVDVRPGVIFDCEVVTRDGVRATAVLKNRDGDANVTFLDVRPAK